MSPFIQNPAGLTRETLELMDNAMKDAWRDLQIKSNESALDKKRTSDTAEAIIKAGSQSAEQ